jgi:serine/threonine-protein kinase HipA
METILKVRLWDKDVAVVNWNKEKEFATMEFFDSFINENMDIAPLFMPLETLRRGDKIFSFPSHKNKTFKGLPGLLADSLPDDYGNSIIDEWFAIKQLSVQITPLDRLSYIGKRAMGALEYEPATDIPALNESAQVEIEELTKLAKNILNQREEFSVKLTEDNQNFINILRVGTSAGGAKPKAIIAINETTGEIRSGQVKVPEGFSYWLLKFDGVEGGKINDNPLGIGRIEYAYYKMALDCGIKMSECHLLEENEHAHFMTKRFDRDNNGEKLHTQTLCALAHFDRDERFSYEQMFQTMRRLFLPYSETEQMFRRMIFNVVARNHDDHTKNHSFIMNKQGEWSLAPTYDLCYSYAPSGKWTSQHQLSLNGKRDDFKWEDLLAIAKKTDIKNASQIIQEIVAVVSNWEEYAKKADVKKEYIPFISQRLRLKF